MHLGCRLPRRERVSICPEMGYMKVLDTIFWKLGKDMEANYEMFPWE